MSSGPMMSRRRALASLLAPAVASCFPDSVLAPFDGLASAVEPVTLIGAGDVHAHKNKASIVRATAALIQADPSATAFVIGDNAGTVGSAVEYGYYNDYWGSFRDRTLFMIGDHEYLEGTGGTPYYDYANGVGAPDGPGGPRGKAYYAKTLGAWRLYFLNSHVLRSEQAAWLSQDLPLYPGLHKAAFWHKPMFASRCTHDGGPTMSVPFQVGPWWDLLQRYKAEFVVSGHVHRYERFARLTRSGVPSASGIRQFIAGTGGGVKYSVLTRHTYSQKRIVAHGVFRLVLHSDHYEWQFIDVAGGIRDSGSQLCKQL